VRERRRVCSEHDQGPQATAAYFRSQTLGGWPLRAHLDSRAVDQTARSLAVAGRGGQATLRKGPLTALSAEEIAGRVLLANVPLPAHESLLSRIGAPPRAAVLSGLRPDQTPAVVAAYRALGLEILAADERGGFRVVSLVAP